MTLVEVLAASVLLGVGVAGLMLSATLGIRNQQRTGHRTAALYLAQAKLAEIEAAGPRVWSLSGQTRGSESIGEMSYEWSATIELMGEGELYNVQVQVSWSGAGDSGMAELETYLNDYRAAALEAKGTGGQGENSRTKSGEPRVK
jgi:type II secretory pathway pseudopilin PulG